MRLNDEKIIDALDIMIPKAQDRHSMIIGFLSCYDCLHNLFPESSNESIIDQVTDTFYIMAMHDNNKELLSMCWDLANKFLEALDDVNALEWALDVIKYNRT